MNLLAINVENDPAKLQVLLTKQIESFKNEGIEIDEKITNHHLYYTLEYSIRNESVKNYPLNDFINIFKYCVANALYEYIKLYEERQLFNRIIEYDYYYFSTKERVEIQDNILKILTKSDGDIHTESYESYQRKFMIIQCFVDYLKENTQLNLKGFIIFRLKDYILELQDIVERAVEDFLMDKEYNEFIKLLRYFVDIQEAKIDIIHIVLEEDNKYKLYDQYSNIVNNEYLKMIAAEMADNDINYEDLLISSLITIAPNKVFIHGVSKNSNQEVIKTISKVFTDKVKMCNSCDWCRVRVKVEKE